MLAFVHFGPYHELNIWLRAHGFPVSTLVRGSTKNRPAIRRYADRYNVFPSVPYLLHVNELRELAAVLTSDGILMVALDVLAARQHVEIPIGEEQEVFLMAVGACRLAAKHGATLLPCNIIQQGPWRFRIELGQPVPTAYLTGDPDFLEAGKHLLAEMLPCWRRHPEQCDSALRTCIRPRVDPR